MNLKAAAVTVLALPAVNAAYAGAPVPLGGALGSALGVTLGLPFGIDLPLDGFVLLGVAAAGLCLGIFIARRPPRR